jgi:hypothetical protein
MEFDPRDPGKGDASAMEISDSIQANADHSTTINPHSHTIAATAMHIIYCVAYMNLTSDLLGHQESSQRLDVFNVLSEPKRT